VPSATAVTWHSAVFTDANDKKRMVIIFLLSIAFVGFTYIGHPCILALLARIRIQEWSKTDQFPRVAVFVAAFNEEKAISAHEESLKKKKPFISLVVENKFVASSDVALAAANEFGSPLVDINLLEIDPDVVKLVKEDLIKKHHALPVFKRGKRLAVAVSDPTNIQALDEFKFAIIRIEDPVSKRL